MSRILAFVVVLFLCFQSYAQKPRARDLGIHFTGTTGAFNAITDVAGVEVGYSTIISGEGENVLGKGLSVYLFQSIFGINRWLPHEDLIPIESAENKRDLMYHKLGRI